MRELVIQRQAQAEGQVPGGVNDQVGQGRIFLSFAQQLGLYGRERCKLAVQVTREQGGAAIRKLIREMKTGRARAEPEAEWAGAGRGNS